MAETAEGSSRVSRVKVIIGGDEYQLRTDQPVKQVEKIAAKVDKELADLAERFPSVTRERLAVLLVLRLTSQLEQTRETARLARKAAKALGGDNEPTAAEQTAAEQAAAGTAPGPASAQAGEEEGPAEPEGPSLFDSVGGEAQE